MHALGITTHEGCITQGVASNCPRDGNMPGLELVSGGEACSRGSLSSSAAVFRASRFCFVPCAPLSACHRDSGLQGLREGVGPAKGFFTRIKGSLLYKSHDAVNG
jgi:hypothetical protein